MVHARSRLRIHSLCPSMCSTSSVPCCRFFLLSSRSRLFCRSFRGSCVPGRWPMGLFLSGFLLVMQLGQIPLGAAELHRHLRHGYSWPPEATEADDHVLPVLPTGARAVACRAFLMNSLFFPAQELAEAIQGHKRRGVDTGTNKSVSGWTGHLERFSQSDEKHAIPHNPTSDAYVYQDAPDSENIRMEAGTCSSYSFRSLPRYVLTI